MNTSIQARTQMMKIDRNMLLSGIALTVRGVAPSIATARRIGTLLDEVAPHMGSGVDNLRQAFSAYQGSQGVDAMVLAQARHEWSQARNQLREITHHRIQDLERESDSAQDNAPTPKA